MKKTIEVANVLLQNNLSEILLLQRGPHLRRSYLWGLPGGLIDEGENSLLAATRELQEETGIEDAALSISGLARFLVEMPEEDIKIANVQAVLLGDNPPITLNPREHIDHKWADREAIYCSKDMLPGVPTMVAACLDYQRQIEDQTLAPGVKVHLLG